MAEKIVLSEVVTSPVRKAGQSHLGKLHPELLLMIFNHLPTYSGLAIKLTSKSHYHASKRPDGTDYLPEPADAWNYHDYQMLIEQDRELQDRTGIYCYRCRRVERWVDYAGHELNRDRNTRICETCFQEQMERIMEERRIDIMDLTGGSDDEGKSGGQFKRRRDLDFS